MADKINLLIILHHSVWQCAALSGLVAGLVAVFKYCNNENKPVHYAIFNHKIQNHIIWINEAYLLIKNDLFIHISKKMYI